MFTNYRPKSVVIFLAKMTERFVAQQLQNILEESGIDAIYQSAYRAHYSAETERVRIHHIGSLETFETQRRLAGT